MLGKELEQGLIATLVFTLHLGVLQVRAGRHPAVNLGREGLNVVGDNEIGLESIDIALGLVLRSEHGEGHLNGLGVVGVDHSGVALSGALEDLVIARNGQRRDLTTPAEPKNRPVECAIGGELVGLRHDLRKPGEVEGWGGLVLEEVAEELLVLVSGRRVPRNIGRLALEEIGHEHTVLLLVRGGQDVGTLDGLVEEAEDVWTANPRLACDSSV